MDQNFPSMPPYDNSNESPDNVDDASDGWVPDAALANLVQERELYPLESNPQTTKRHLDENSPLVVQSIVRLALHSRSERTRLDAGKYVLDRVLGRIGDEKLDGTESPITKLIEEITEFVAASAEE